MNRRIHFLSFFLSSSSFCNNNSLASAEAADEAADNGVLLAGEDSVVD
jgi:hypothetical protein